MRLQRAANAFNDMACVDAYTGQLAFWGQLGLYDDTKRDSETTERRVISASPDAVVPSRRVVEAAGMRFIVGTGQPDSFRGKVIRVGYIGHEATELSTVRTLAQACLNQQGVQAWAGRAWVKNVSYTEQSSLLVMQHHIHFAVGEPVAANSLITLGGRLLVTRTSEEGAAGTLIALCEELPDPVITTATVSTGEYSPVTGTFGGGTTSVRVVRVRWQSLFEYRSNTAPKFGPDDIQVVLAKSDITARPGMKLSMADGQWQIASALSEGDVWICRATQHA